MIAANCPGVAVFIIQKREGKMNVQTASLTMITEVDYLEGERLSDIRHEYLAGQVYAMAGTSKVHNLIAGNLYSIIRSHITGKSCQAFMSDTKVRLADQNMYSIRITSITNITANTTNICLTGKERI